ncbi:MAG: hypothetical protein J5930_08645 [Treponema sp.]|nr:hypothetical protein [Treponema sp.]
MKRNNKLLALFSGLLVMVGLSVTSCNPDVAASFGKDYFFGTWKTTDFDASGNRQTYYRNSDGKYYTITWKFDGKSENLFNTDGGSFRQHLINWGITAPTVNADGTLTGSKENETVWIGAYKLKGNSSYSRGKLFLYYEFGVDLIGEEQPTSLNYEEVKDWTSENYLNYAFYGNKDAPSGKTAGLDLLDDVDQKLSANSYDNRKVVKVTSMEPLTYTLSDSTPEGNGSIVSNHVTIQVRGKANPKCSDVEYFRFNLKDATASGYSRMMATVMDKDGSTKIGKTYSQWVGNDTSYGTKVYEECSWSNVATRCLARISVSDTGNETQWVSNDTRSNSTLFHMTAGNSVDNSDTTDYTDTEATVADGTAEE